MKTKGLTGLALDWAVAKCEGISIGEGSGVTFAQEFKLKHDAGDLRYSSDWALGGPIIEMKGITTVFAEGEYSTKLRGYKTFWLADLGVQCFESRYGPQGDEWGNCYPISEECISGSTPLMAAMRCYVASKLGDEIEIPEELK